MKAFKNLKFRIDILANLLDNCFWWDAAVSESDIIAFGIEDWCGILTAKKAFKTQKGARNHWKKFAKLNNISDWKFEK